MLPHFNSRSRVGSDLIKPFIVFIICIFQFTLPCRERLFPVQKVKDALPFQFTLPCRERRFLNKIFNCFFHFNSRSRVGSDNNRSIDQSNLTNFNSRSRVGSDEAFLPFLPPPNYFNSRSRVGSDVFLLPQATIPLPYFNSRSRVGSDPVKFRNGYLLDDFNSRSRVGSDFPIRLRIG